MIYVNQLNSFDENIQFTFEIEEENNIAFLDLMVIGNRGEAKKAPPPNSFSSVPSTNVGISPQNFLTFSFNPIATLM